MICYAGHEGTIEVGHFQISYLGWERCELKDVHYHGSVVYNAMVSVVIALTNPIV